MSEATDSPALFLQSQNGGTIAYKNRPSKQSLRQPGIVFCGGYRSNMEGNKANALDAFCQQKGYAFTRFDYQGHGASSGVFEEGTIGLWYENALEVIEKITDGPQILVGSSMGGWIAMLLARARPEMTKSLVLIAPAPDFPSRLIWPNLSDIDRQNLIDKGLMSRPSQFADGDYPYTWRMIEESKDHNLLSGDVIEYDGPVHVFIGDDDDVIPVRHAEQAANAFPAENVSFTVVPGGDHRLSEPGDLERLTGLLTHLTEN